MSTALLIGESTTDKDSRALGDHVAGQLLRLGAVAGLKDSDAALYAQILADSLGDASTRPLSLPPPSASFVSDDHTPVEFSLTFRPDAAPGLRVLVEPGFAAGDMAQSGRQGLTAVRDMADRWNFSTTRLDRLEDLFFPPDAQGPLALWYALELRPSGAPGVKVYLNPAASGPGKAAATVREALHRLGHPEAFEALPDQADHLFLALDLGAWDTPRVKIYTGHPGLSAPQVCALSRVEPGPALQDVRAFFRHAAGADPQHGPESGHEPRLLGRRAVYCHSFTDTAAGRPTGSTLYIPVCDMVRDDEVALARTTAALTHFGMDPSMVRPAMAAVATRQLSDGVGLIPYLGLAHQRGRRPRITVYLASEAYTVRPPLPDPPGGASAGERPTANQSSTH